MYEVWKRSASMELADLQEALYEQDENERKLLCIPRRYWHAFDWDTVYATDAQIIELMTEHETDNLTEIVDTFDNADEAMRALESSTPRTWVEDGIIYAEIYELAEDGAIEYQKAEGYEGSSRYDRAD